MNIVQISSQNLLKKPKVPQILFARMEDSLKSSGANFEKNVRLAKTLAPLLEDQSSNERHIALIENNDTPIQEKIIALLMLGFPKNRPLLPFLKNILATSTDSMRIAAAIAIAQMKDGSNNELLSEILLEAYENSSADLRKTIRQALLSLIDKKSRRIVQVLALHA